MQNVRILLAKTLTFTLVNDITLNKLWFKMQTKVSPLSCSIPEKPAFARENDGEQEKLIIFIRHTTTHDFRLSVNWALHQTPVTRSNG